MSAVQCRDGQNIHKGKDDGEECRHVPELVPVPRGGENTADGSETSELLGSFLGEEIFHLAYVAFQSLYPQRYAGRERGKETVFLADIVDYGEYKNGSRSESITFSMKGFLQKMAYTIQTVILFGGLGIFGYNEQIKEGVINNATKNAIGTIAFGIPPILIIISMIVFRSKFKIHGELAEKIHSYITEKRAADGDEK